jgi:hypothetical protein
VRRLTEAAREAALAWDDFSLVGLAALVRDSVVLAATRESVVLYAEVAIPSAMPGWQRPPKYVWEVDEGLARQARKFVEAFASLFGERLPRPEASSAELYWDAHESNDVLGRCVRIGYDDSSRRHYHWAVCHDALGELTVQEFWHHELWTTERYRGELRGGGGCPRI